MKIIIKKYQVYEYDELTKDAQNKVINDHIKWIIECIPYDKLSLDMKRAVDKSESMQTPWFVGSYIYEYAMNEILEYVKTQSYLINGDIFDE